MPLRDAIWDLVASVANRGAEAASLHVLPTLWFRNTWTGGLDQPKPSLRQRPENTVAIEASHAELGGLSARAIRNRPGITPISRLSRHSRNQRGISNALHPRLYGLFLDDLPIHIRPDLPAARVQT